MPRTKNSSANMVLPQPGPPHTKLGRPFGSPPDVSSSNPRMPVGLFFSAVGTEPGLLAPLERARFCDDDFLDIAVGYPEGSEITRRHTDREMLRLNPAKESVMRAL